MNRLKKIVSLGITIVLLVTCLTGCAKNNLLSVYFNKTDFPVSEETDANKTSTKDKVDKKNDAMRLENSRVEVTNLVSMSDSARVNSLTLEELDYICNVKNNLLNNLKIEFNYNRVPSTISLKEGIASLKAKNLFVENEGTLSANGEQLLSAFLQVYTFVIYHTNYKDCVSGVSLIYQAGAEESSALAQQRLNSILGVITDPHRSGIDAKFDEKFRGMLTSKFYPYDGTEENEKGSIIFKITIDLDRIME